jgi:hypothetical protein
MKLKPNETLVRLEDISPEAIKELTPVLAQIEDYDKELKLAISNLAMLKAKGDYLSKLKWKIFDTFHPDTSEALHKVEPNMNASRRYDWAEKKVALVEYPLDIQGMPGFLAEILMEALGGNKPNKPKEPAPEAAETAAAG